MSPQTPAYYRARAEECEQIAAEATDHEAREIMTDLAYRWRALATLDETRRAPIQPQHRTPSPSPEEEP